MRQFSKTILALCLAAALLCPAAQAASRTPALRMSGGSQGDVRLTLEELGSQEVSSVQLTLTLNGRYSGASFVQNGSVSGQYSQCRAEETGNQTTITIYIDSMKPLNQNGTVNLGTLKLGSRCNAPGSAQLTVLDRDLNAADAAGTIPVRDSMDSSGGSSGGSGGGSAGGSGGGSSGGSSGSSGSSSGGSSAGTDKNPPPQTALPFTDVKKGIWYYDAVRYAYEKNLMAGISSAAFGPDLPTSRGMIVTILYRLAGSPASGASDFTDVAAGKYYAGAVAWAAANGVVSGYGDGRFGPDDPITREQAAVILRGYARLKGKDVSAQANLSGFSDVGQISGYALEAMRWANAQGLINGTSATTLTPSGTATRAQAAVILQAFCERVLK